MTSQEGDRERPVRSFIPKKKPAVHRKKNEQSGQRVQQRGAQLGTNRAKSGAQHPSSAYTTMTTAGKRLCYSASSGGRPRSMGEERSRQRLLRVLAPGQAMCHGCSDPALQWASPPKGARRCSHRVHQFPIGVWNGLRCNAMRASVICLPSAPLLLFWQRDLFLRWKDRLQTRL